MRPTFHPSLVNGPLGDPALLVRLLGHGRTLFFDLGDLHALPARPVLRAGHAFVSHAHIYHFCGFDTVLRYFLGREKTFRLVGPPGITDRVRAKLDGYTWNLVATFADEFTVEVLEWGAEGHRLTSFRCREGFAPRREEPSPDGREEGAVKVVHSEPAFRVLAAPLDHQIPSLGFRIEEPVHVNVAPEGLSRLGLEPGPWVRSLKDAVFRGEPPEARIEIPGGKGLPIGSFLDAAAVVLTPGQKLAYVADCAWSGTTRRGAEALARGVHVLYCEAAFSNADEVRARERHHLTAAQAGELARLAGVGELRIFHFSPKYKGRERELIEEAAEAFGGPVRMGP
jgi:ribonuclease Z